MLNENKKRIYNSYLINSRKCRNKPFKVRKNFDRIDNDILYILIKLENLFKNYPNIDLDTYFSAPFMLFKDINHFALDYFATPAAIRSYTLYKKKILEEDIDSKSSLDAIKNGLQFIAKYCIVNNITLNEYYTHKSGLTYTWMKHIRKSNIIPYIAFGFKNVDELVFNIPEDERDLLLGNFGEKYYIFKGKYNSSKKAKPLIQNGLIKIKKWINDELKNKTVEKKK